ncbi:acyl carrier protein [Nocardia puris]|uniref:Acyl carrier protein n=1 Tax=Nocardia puris TaxID=208602 RepID=A0A366CUV9_9NOCA|nr:acyl carrier protein [Nocardia puris]MBF6215989.1 acyl carrier protein [Nocardia puris]MBF6370261.1 acyl carrier protein [Nocardia puris]MBF6463167.1 acyl carrier protein [Nocardia puris]RBO80094.1 acyl carrier protein [Nocardia puris]
MSTTTDIEAKVRTIVGEVLWVPAGDLEPGTPLVDYGLDSPTAIELTIQLEQEFGVDIPEDVAARLNTVGEIVAHVRGAA